MMKLSPISVIRARVPHRHLGQLGAALPPARPLLHDLLLRVSEEKTDSKKGVPAG